MPHPAVTKRTQIQLRSDFGMISSEISHRGLMFSSETGSLKRLVSFEGPLSIYEYCTLALLRWQFPAEALFLTPPSGEFETSRHRCAVVIRDSRKVVLEAPYYAIPVQAEAWRFAAECSRKAALEPPSRPSETSHGGRGRLLSHRS